MALCCEALSSWRTVHRSLILPAMAACLSFANSKIFTGFVSEIRLISNRLSLPTWRNIGLVLSEDALSLEGASSENPRETGTLRRKIASKSSSGSFNEKILGPPAWTPSPFLGSLSFSVLGNEEFGSDGMIFQESPFISSKKTESANKKVTN